MVAWLYLVVLRGEYAVPRVSGQCDLDHARLLASTRCRTGDKARARGLAKETVEGLMSGRPHLVVEVRDTGVAKQDL